MIYGDLHCDTLWRCYEEHLPLEHPSLQLRPHSSYGRIQTYAVYIPPSVGDPLAYFRAVYANGQTLLQKEPHLELCRNGGQLNEILSAGKTPYLVSVEGGGFFNGELAHDKGVVRELKEAGVCFISLCYSNGNHLAGGVNDPSKPLTEAGKNAALLLCEAGISLDISHLNPRSANALLELLPNGVAATHSNCISLCNHPRNLSDDQICALGEKQGLMGINFYPPFLKEKGPAAIEDVLAHIAHVRHLGASHILAFGSDFDGIQTTPRGLEDSDQIPNLAHALSAEWGEPFARACLFENMRSYLLRNFK